MPDSSLGMVILTVFISSSLELPVPASLASQPGTAPSVRILPRGRDPPNEGDYIVRRASHPTVTSDACLPRLPLVVQRVRYPLAGKMVGQ
jgi:hypothetical protein